MNNKIVFLLNLIFIFCLFYLVYLEIYTLPELNTSAVYDNIMQRKSVRNYLSDKIVSDEQIEKMLHAAMAAPTARNTQPWEFIVIKDKETLELLSEQINSAKMLNEANCAIVVLGNLNKLDDMTDFWSQDTSAATQNILLEAEALGLGAVWIGVYPLKDRIEVLKETFKLPKDVIPFNIISIGYPDGSDKPKDKWNIKNIHYEKY